MIPLFPVEAICPVCRKACLDSFGEHVVLCKELTCFMYRHDMVRDILFDICRRARISVKKEALVNFLTDPSDGRSTLRPADILVFGWVGGKHACVDLTGVSPLVRLCSRGFTVGEAALKAASCKVTKHEKACFENQHVFIPFAFDTFGFLAPEAVELLTRVQRVMNRLRRSLISLGILGKEGYTLKMQMGRIKARFTRSKVCVIKHIPKGQILKELRDNTFNGSDHEDANEDNEKVLEIVNLFHIPNITQDQEMLKAFPISLTRVVSRWLRNKPYGSITNWEDLKIKFLGKYCLPSQTAKKMEEINNFQQEPDETLYQAWERLKEISIKCPQHYLTEMQETAADAKVAIQEMAEYSQKWHNGTSRTRSTETSDGLAAIQAQLNNLGREIKKVNEKVYATQVGCEQCKGPHYTKDSPLKEEGKTLEEAYYSQFGGPFQGGGYRAAALGFHQRNNANPSYQERRQSMEETLSKFMSESAKRHEEKSNMINEI
ncbi:hypothetical protein Tco_0433395 [Tanacetum coccineum]